ncbi:MAG: SGNH/GDSL hydrolase family protein [Acidobacteria bacterium]|nr:SGNH/GDSL hydrolase family protein [Acidobacteriota bacterium]
MYVGQAAARRLRALLAVRAGVSLAGCAGGARHFGGESGMGVGGGAEAEARAAVGGPVVYVALGDSTGVGVGARAGGGYVARLFERIERERPGSRVINLCVSGARTDDVLRRQLPHVAAARPTLITVGIGINDLTNFAPAETFEANYDEIVSRLRADAPGARVVLSNIPDISPAPAVPAALRADAVRRIRLFNEIIGRVAARHGARVADAYHPSREVIAAHPEFFSDDGFHPSAEGYEYWAKMLWPAVKEEIGENE